MLLVSLGFFQLLALVHGSGESCSGSKPNKLKFTIKYDYWPQEVSWTVKNNVTKEIVLKGNGTNAQDLSEASQTTCVEEGCYLLRLNDSYGDGFSSGGYYGWFTLELNQSLLTLGEQSFEGDFSDLFFCTILFDKNERDASSLTDLQFTTYDYSSDISISNADTSDYTPLYYNMYGFPDYFNSSQINVLTIGFDSNTHNSAKADNCYNVLLDDGYFDTTKGHYKVEILQNGEKINYHESDTENLQFSLCKNTSYTSAPTSKPTYGLPDYVLRVGQNNIYSKSGYLGCPSGTYSYASGCSDTSTWQIVGNCKNPRLTMKVYESDYDLDSEESFLYINDEYLGTCNINTSCIDAFHTCQHVADSLDISNYLVEQDVGFIHDKVTFVDIGITCSSAVNVCGKEINQTSEHGLKSGLYYCLAEATIECDIPSNDTQGTLPLTTQQGGTSSDGSYNLTITLEFDESPEDLLWVVYNSDTATFRNVFCVK